MGEKYIKKEDGKEVAYEKGLFGDKKIGELHGTWDGAKETRNIFGENVRVEKEGIFSREREGKVGDQKGVFSKSLLDKYPTFKPKEDEGGSYSSSGDGESCFVATVVYGGTAPQLDTLRWYRDNVLNKNYFGRSFVKLYYSGLGGKVAKLIGHIPGAVPLVRKGLDNLVEKYSQYNNKRISK